MEFVIGAISLASLTLNYLIYRRITATYVIGSVEEFELATAHFCQCETVVEHPQPEQEPVQDPEPPKQSVEAYQAWTNRQGIPWVPPVKPPEPIKKAPNRGPLARPDGFI
jgi:hypothetical protein